MKNSVLPFASNPVSDFASDAVLNLSSVNLIEEQLDILKYGVKHPIEAKMIKKTDLLTTFHFTHRAKRKDIKYNRDAGKVKANLSYLVNPYMNIE